MLDFDFLGSKFGDVVKTILAIKIILFLLLSGADSVYNIFANMTFDDCVQEILLEFELTDVSSPTAKAVHFCQGGGNLSELKGGK